MNFLNCITIKKSDMNRFNFKEFHAKGNEKEDWKILDVNLDQSWATGPDSGSK